MSEKESVRKKAILVSKRVKELSQGERGSKRLAKYLNRYSCKANFIFSSQNKEQMREEPRHLLFLVMNRLFQSEKQLLKF